jgi:two-component system NtrC family sensor kinase
MSFSFSRLGDLARKLLGFRYLVVGSSLLFFAILGIALYLVYKNSRVMQDQITADFNQQQLILAYQAASQINALIGDLEIEIKSLMALQDRTPEGVSRETMQAMMERTRGKGLLEIGLMDHSGRVIRFYDLRGGRRISPERLKDYGRLEASGGMKLNRLQAETSASGETLVTSKFCLPITLGGGEMGKLFARLDVSRLVARVTSEIRSGRTGYAWVIDQSGLFLYHPEKDFVGKNAFTARAERQPYISFAQINRIMKERMLRGEEGVGIYESGWHRGMEGKITKLIAFTPVRSSALAPGGLWSVAVAAPISEVSEAVRQVYTRHFAAEAVLIAGMFLFGLLVVIYQGRISETLKARVERTEADLHETERIYQRVVEQATDLIYILDLEMRVVLFNRHSINTFSNLVVSERFGGVIPEGADLSRAELYVGRRLNELFPPADVEFMRRQMDQVLERKASHSFEQTLNLMGRQVHLSSKLIPIRNSKGEVYQILGISRDVTERREMDQRIYNTEKLASIGTLAAGVAHEINNPLAIILGFTDLLLERFPPHGPEYEDLKMIEYNANHAKQVVENLLGFARIAEGLEDTVDINHSVNMVTRIIQNTLMTKKVELQVSIPDNLPRVRGDTREFQQVIFNLVNNSIAAMEKSGGTLTITARGEGEWVHVSVSDTGEGIPNRIKPQIFDPFFTTKKVGEGTGLGLSLCYGIVKKYGGRISFSSSCAEDNPLVPSGTIFTVSMPNHQSPA